MNNIRYQLSIFIFILLLINFLLFPKFLISNNGYAQFTSNANSVNNSKSEFKNPITILRSDSLNETTNRLVTLIQSINSTLSRSIDQGGYTAISAYAASGSSIAAAFSAIILLISFLSQNKLIKGQIQQHNIYLKNQREIHYQQIREILKTATEHNSFFRLNSNFS